MGRKVLGKGLGALIPDNLNTVSTDGSQGVEQDTPIQNRIVNIPIDKIKSNKYQPREEFDEESIRDLAVSVKEKGFIQPVIVRANQGEYELISGERRVRAAKLLDFKEIPSIVKDASDLDSLEMSIIENVQREDLNAIDQAKAYKRLLEEFHMSYEDIGDTVGKDRSTIANIIRLLKLPIKIQAAVSRGILSMGHARAIVSLTNESEQMRLFTKVVKKGLSVRDTERYSKTMVPIEKKTIVERDADLVSIEEGLREFLGTRVAITKGKRGGKIEIVFYSNTDLERIVGLLIKSTS